MGHEQLTGKSKEALGICWAEYDEAGKLVPFRITIDEFFIHECFLALEKPYMKIEPQTLEQVIAHEIAHLHVWRHGKKHTALTERICRLMEARFDAAAQKLPEGEFIDDCAWGVDVPAEWNEFTEEWA